MLEKLVGGYELLDKKKTPKKTFHFGQNMIKKKKTIPVYLEKSPQADNIEVLLSLSLQ